jgi:hypothetical protein
MKRGSETNQPFAHSDTSRYGIFTSPRGAAFLRVQVFGAAPPRRVPTKDRAVSHQKTARAKLTIFTTATIKAEMTAAGNGVFTHPWPYAACCSEGGGGTFSETVSITPESENTTSTCTSDIWCCRKYPIARRELPKSNASARFRVHLPASVTYNPSAACWRRIRIRIGNMITGSATRTIG